MEQAIWGEGLSHRYEDTKGKFDRVLTDDELVARCKLDLPDKSYCFETLVRRYRRHVFFLAYRVLGNREEAEDIVQEVFVKVYNHLKTFEQRAPFSTWLHRITINMSLDALTKAKRHSKTTVSITIYNQGLHMMENTMLNLYPHSLSNHEPEAYMLQADLRESVWHVLGILDQEQSRLLIMRDVDGLSYDEIAKRLDTSLGAVKMRLHRARNAFQKNYKLRYSQL